MKKKLFMIEFELPEEMTEEFQSLVPEQRHVVDKWLSEGVIKSYSLAMDRSVLWVVVEAASEFQVLEIIEQMPLADFLDPYISELMFHNSSEAMQHFSLN